jgi:hypothetical protein
MESSVVRNVRVAWMSVLLMMVLLFPGGSRAAEEEPLPLHQALEPMRPFLGITWRGDLTDPGSKRRRFDVVRYDRTLNGEAIRMLHSVNNGDLGGEMLIRYDEEDARVEYHYFTSAGFLTTGSIRFRGRSFVAEDDVKEGQVPMRTVRRLDGDRLVSSTQMLRDGRWTRGTEQFYEPAPDEKIRYR